MSQRIAFSIVELMVGVTMLATCGMGLASLFTAGTGGAARAADALEATTIAARLVDRLQALGFATLSRKTGPTVVSDLTFVHDPFARSPAYPVPLEHDGATYSATEQISALTPDLLRIEITLTWNRTNHSGARPPGSLTVVKYVADPAAGMRIRPGGN